MGRWRTTKIDSTHSSGVVSWLVTNFLLNLLEVFLFCVFWPNFVSCTGVETGWVPLHQNGHGWWSKTLGVLGEHKLVIIDQLEILKTNQTTTRHCNHHKEPGLVAIDFLSIMHDEDNEEEDYGALDEEYHDAYFNQLERKKKEVSSSAEHHRGDLIAKVKSKEHCWNTNPVSIDSNFAAQPQVEMESKCNPVVTIKLASKKYKSPQISSQHKEAATKRTFSRPNQIVTNMPTKRSSSTPSFKLAVDEVEEVFHEKTLANLLWSFSHRRTIIWYFLGGGLRRPRLRTKCDFGRFGFWREERWR